MPSTEDQTPTDPEVLTVDHIAIAVDNIEQTVFFFERLMGFRVLSRRITRGQSTSMLSAVVQAGPVVLVIVQGVEENSQVTRFVRAHGSGVQHVAFSVKNLEALMQRLTDGGVRADTQVLKNPGLTQVFLSKNKGSGVRLELIERTGGDFTDESVERLFREFESRDLY